MHTANLEWPLWLPHLILREHKCPRCNSVQFRSDTQRGYDGLLALFALRPVRCTFCWRRYYWFALHAPAGE
jgi:hypothetical protein